MGIFTIDGMRCGRISSGEEVVRWWGAKAEDKESFCMETFESFTSRIVC